MKRSIKISTSRCAEWVFLCAVVLAGFAWRMSAQAGYPLTTDEAASFRVMAAIAETGMPWIYEGLLYWRSLLAHYLMAIPLLFTEDSLAVMRAGSIAAGALCLAATWDVTRRLAGRLVAAAAVAVLFCSAFENSLVIGNRFYGPFQLFFLLSTFWGVRCFAEREGRYLWPWFGATLLAFGCHELALLLWLVPPLGALCSGGWRQFVARRTLAALALLVPAAWLLLIYKPPNAFYNVAAVPLVPGAMSDTWYFARLFELSLPGFAAGWLLAVAWALRNHDGRFRALLTFFSVALLLLSLASPMENSRYAAPLFPLAVILSVAGPGLWLRHWLTSGRRRAGAVKSLLLAAFVLSLAIGARALLPDAGRVQVLGHPAHAPDARAAHAFLRDNSRPGELIVSMEPLVTEFLLERPVDYLLRQRYNPDLKRLEEFPAEERPYLGHPVVDSVEKLLDLAGSGPVWVVVNSRGSTIDDAMKYMLNRNFRVAYTSIGGSVLVGR